MPFIEEAEHEPDKESLALRIQTDTKRELEAYATWLKYESVSECADKILRRAFRKDEDWQQHLAAHPEAIQKKVTRHRTKPTTLKAAS